MLSLTQHVFELSTERFGISYNHIIINRITTSTLLTMILARFYPLNKSESIRGCDIQTAKNIKRIISRARKLQAIVNNVRYSMQG